MAKVSIEEIKIAIDDLPQSSLDKLLLFIEQLKSTELERKPITSLHLKGKFDSLDIRAEAYE
jgi:hypothetical protein